MEKACAVSDFVYREQPEAARFRPIPRRLPDRVSGAMPGGRRRDVTPAGGYVVDRATSVFPLLYLAPAAATLALQLAA
ncbi:hypothetical protein APR12_001135 [Nocardia amikacinitolerans]|uniref:hypothetical protein n=1 Tax=Nocardia amikacinitolerans TaxID=756689 RepID=UPI000832759D|nr:hypothetical protein [Nocardia amikacinitolerans]MCP2315802.1 hypothetical protein [Nocardia amikacinitolerans]